MLTREGRRLRDLMRITAGAAIHSMMERYYDGGQTPAGPDRGNGYGLYNIAGNVDEWC